MKITTSYWLAFGVIGALSLVGCANPNDKIDPKTPVGGKESKEYVPTAMAGVSKDITKSIDPKRNLPFIASTVRFGHRSNPFAMSADEMLFDRSQASEKIVIDGGSFGELYQLPDDKLPIAEPMEPQPYRRLSGILIGDSVLAILEEGNKSTIVRPGMMIPDTDWQVVSIDRDKAVLRRVGSTRLPREVEVRLEVGLPFQGGGNGGAGQGRGPGAPGSPPSAGKTNGGGVASGN